MSRWFLLAPLLGLLVTSCASLNNASQYQLQNGYYDFREPGTNYSKVYIKVDGDSISILPTSATGQAKTIHASSDELFLKKSFDVDVLVVPFKYRPAAADVPRQLNTDFNGNLFLGYRLDRFRLQYSNTPGGTSKKLKHRAITLGATGGIGSASVTPFTTQNKITQEYNGFIFSRGVALMVGIDNLTVGMGLGWDYLTDRDKNIWIYQNKPWLGLTLSLNLN